MKNIFIIGSKGIPANYGGFETFVEKLTAKKVTEEIKYHVACMSDNNEEFNYNNARCFNISVPNIGAAKAIYYDLVALNKSLEYIKKNKIRNCIVYILACRIGPFLKYFKRIAKKLNVEIYVNPDGHEWKRGKWNYFVKKYWKLSEKLMVKHSDLLICDSVNIEKYIINEYKKYNPITKYISYGAENVITNESDEEKLKLWYEEKDIERKEYFLIVGRFVPENNYELMIREFLKSKIKKDLVIITNYENNKFYKLLKEKTRFEDDNRIKFVGTVYDQKLLKLIRENAYGYVHGHEVGGTNPSLLEALATTDLNLLLNVGFNKEVAKDSAMYFGKEVGSLKQILEKSDDLSEKEIEVLSSKAKLRISEEYSWSYIVNLYEELFLEKE